MNHPQSELELLMMDDDGKEHFNLKVANSVVVAQV